MFELIKNVLFASVGAAYITKEKATEIVDELIEKGHLQREEKTRRIKELMETAGLKVKEFSGLVEEKVRQVVDAMKISERVEIEELKSQVEKLKKELSDLKTDSEQRG